MVSIFKRNGTLQALGWIIVVTCMNSVRGDESGAGQTTSPAPTTGSNSRLEGPNLFSINLDEELKSKSLQQNQRLTLECLITGYPVPVYEWFKDGVPISTSNRRITISNVDWGNRLRISGMTASDSGLYTCEARNIAGFKNTSATVTVYPVRTTPGPRVQTVVTKGDDSNIASPFCQKYKGGVCNYLLSKKIYVMSRVDQHEGERRVLEMIKGFTDKGVLATTRCFQKSVEASCYVQMPVCVERSQPPTSRRLCKQECMALYQICKSHLGENAGDWDLLPNCSPLDDSADCIHIGLTAQPTAPSSGVITSAKSDESSSDLLMMVVLPVSIVALLVLASIIVTICVCKRRNKLPGTSIPSSNGSQGKSVELSSLSERAAPTYIKDISLDNINMLQELGESSYGKVYHGQVFGLYGYNTASAVFIKCLQEKATPEQQHEFKEEIASMSELRHQHVVSLLAVSTKGLTQCLLYEHLQLGDLRQFILSQQSRGNTLSPKELMYIVTQVASALEYLSGLQYVHRDVAAHNVIVSHNLNVKLSSLNIIHGVHSSNYCTLHSKLLPIRWLPAESITYNKFSTETDIYSYGVFLWETFSGAQQPYSGFTNQEVIEMVRSRQLLACNSLCPPRLYSLMVECWHETPGKRPTAKEVHQKLRAWYLDNSYAISTTTGPSISASGSTCTAPSHHSSSGLPASVPNSNYTNLTNEQGSRNAVDEPLLRPGHLKEDTAPYYSTIDSSYEPNGGRHTPSSSSFDNASEYTDSTNPPLPASNRMPPSYYACSPAQKYASLNRRHPDGEFAAQATPIFQHTDQV